MGSQVSQTDQQAGPGGNITAGGGDNDAADMEALDFILPESAEGLTPVAQVGLVASVSALAVLGAVAAARTVDRVRGGSRHSY
ncbi:MAG: hypothetical protein CSA58_10085 [Micrococcales bacterium]|nr:MAG: hypothetical protein CSA58_10085 [Micrococcales bacterium]